MPPGGVGADRYANAYNMQREFYNAWNKYNGLKYEVMVNPDGLAMRLAGPVSLRRNDAFLLQEYSTNVTLVQAQIEEGVPHNNLYSVYGDSAYVLTDCIKRRPNQPWLPHEQLYAYCMCSIRESVEHYIGITSNKWKLTNSWWDIKIGRESDRNMDCIRYNIATLLTNAVTCCEMGNIVSETFNLKPVTVEEYFTLPEN